MAASMAKALTRTKFCFIRRSHIAIRVHRASSSYQLFVDTFGDPNTVVADRTVELPAKLKDCEVLVKMKNAPINPSDINMIEGTYFLKPQLPAVAGNEGVGEIVELGKEVRGLNLGDWVIPAESGMGTWRTFLTAKEDNVIKIPNDIPVLSAATMSVNSCTAYRMLKDFVTLHEGDFIIQNGANSGVGIDVIQLAKAWNFKTINIVRDRENIDELRDYLISCGADFVFTENFVRTPEMKDFLKSLPSKPKLAFNCVGGSSASELIRHVDHGGVVVTYGGMSRKPVTAPTGALIFKEIKLCGYFNTKWNQNNRNSLKRFEMLADLCDLMRQSKLVSQPCDYFSLQDYKTAIKGATQGFKGSKKVFRMD